MSLVLIESFQGRMILRYSCLFDERQEGSINKLCSVQSYELYNSKSQFGNIHLSLSLSLFPHRRSALFRYTNQITRDRCHPYHINNGCVLVFVDGCVSVNAWYMFFPRYLIVTIMNEYSIVVIFPHRHGAWSD